MNGAKLCITWDSYLKQVSQGFSLLQQNAEFVDMTLAADGHLVKVHQNIVALASPYLKAMLQSASCQHPVIFLNNISHEILSYILVYIYMGEVKVPIGSIGKFIDACKSLTIRGVDVIDMPTTAPPKQPDPPIKRIKIPPDNNVAAQMTFSTEYNHGNVNLQNNIVAHDVDVEMPLAPSANVSNNTKLAKNINIEPEKTKLVEDYETNIEKDIDTNSINNFIIMKPKKPLASTASIANNTKNINIEPEKTEPVKDYESNTEKDIDTNSFNKFMNMKPKEDLPPTANVSDNTKNEKFEPQNNEIFENHETNIENQNDINKFMIMKPKVYLAPTANASDNTKNVNSEPENTAIVEDYETTIENDNDVNNINNFIIMKPKVPLAPTANVSDNTKNVNIDPENIVVDYETTIENDNDVSNINKFIIMKPKVTLGPTANVSDNTENVNIEPENSGMVKDFETTIENDIDINNINKFIIMKPKDTNVKKGHIEILSDITLKTDDWLSGPITSTTQPYNPENPINIILNTNQYPESNQNNTVAIKNIDNSWLATLDSSANMEFNTNTISNPVNITISTNEYQQNPIQSIAQIQLNTEKEDETDDLSTLNLLLHKKPVRNKLIKKMRSHIRIENKAKGTSNKTILSKELRAQMDQVPHYTVSNRGSLQMLLECYLYNLHHQSSFGRKKRWRCIDYRKKHCQSYIDTDNDQVTAVSTDHEHPNHELQIKQKIKSNVIFTCLTHALKTINSFKNGDSGVETAISKKSRR